jgi:hypothetical protein
MTGLGTLKVKPSSLMLRRSGKNDKKWRFPAREGRSGQFSNKDCAGRTVFFFYASTLAPLTNRRRSSHF